MILITGSNGQVGVDLTKALSDLHGGDCLLASDLTQPNSHLPSDVAFEPLDVRDSLRLGELLDRYAIDTIYHLAGILSANGERQPDLCWDVNVGGLMNVLNASRLRKLRVFWPSSIAVFGPRTPRHDANQTAQTDPKTMYGITKVSAGSKTNPGGYSGHSDAIEQFEVDDKRSPVEVAAMISNQGFEPVWKDWDGAFLGNQDE